MKRSSISSLGISVKYIILERVNKVLINRRCTSCSQINTEARNIESGLVNKLILLFSIDWAWNLNSYEYFLKHYQRKIE